MFEEMALRGMLQALIWGGLAFAAYWSACLLSRVIPEGRVKRILYRRLGS
ncbi:MAG: hypothetical protein ACR2RL_21830 [Gammaproteobacteria bacterium]